MVTTVNGIEKFELGVSTSFIYSVGGQTLYGSIKIVNGSFIQGLRLMDILFGRSLILRKF